MNAWIFDVDGVITNPTKKTVTELRIFDEIVKRLKRKDPVCFNTGRSIDFIVEKVLVLLEQRVNGKSLLNNIFAIGEMGGVTIFYENGKRREETDSQITVPQSLKAKIRSLVEKEFSDVMFFDETKKTMITVEMKPGKSLDEFHERQANLVQILKELVEKEGYAGIKVDATTIAIDIQNMHTGKSYGAKRFLQMLDQRGISPEQFICFGDSNSDFEMFDELKKAGKNILFVFVGKKTDRKGVIETQRHFDQGALEYLISN